MQAEAGEVRMTFTESEMREDLSKVRIRKYVLLGGGLGILGLAVALVVAFFVRRDWPALLLAGVGFFWSAVLFRQYYLTRRLEGAIESRMAAGSDEAPGVSPGEIEGGAAATPDAPDPTGGDASEDGGAQGEP